MVLLTISNANRFVWVSLQFLISFSFVETHSSWTKFSNHSLNVPFNTTNLIESSIQAFLQNTPDERCCFWHSFHVGLSDPISPAIRNPNKIILYNEFNYVTIIYFRMIRSNVSCEKKNEEELPLSPQIEIILYSKMVHFVYTHCANKKSGSQNMGLFINQKKNPL